MPGTTSITVGLPARSTVRTKWRLVAFPSLACVLFTIRVETVQRLADQLLLRPTRQGLKRGVDLFDEAMAIHEESGLLHHPKSAF